MHQGDEPNLSKQRLLDSFKARRKSFVTLQVVIYSGQSSGQVEICFI